MPECPCCHSFHVGLGGGVFQLSPLNASPRKRKILLMVLMSLLCVATVAVLRLVILIHTIIYLLERFGPCFHGHGVGDQGVHLARGSITQGVRNLILVLLVIIICLVDIVGIGIIAGHYNRMDRCGFVEGNGVLTMLLNSLESEVANEQANYIVLGKKILAFRVVSGKFRHRPGRHGLNLHWTVFEDFRKHRTNSRMDHVLHAFRVTAKQSNRSGSILLALQLTIFNQFQQRSNPTFLNNQLPIPVVIPSKRNQRSRRIRSVFKRTRIENSNLFPYEAENRLVGGDGRQSQVPIISSIGRGRDTEEPGDISYRILELRRHFPERCSGNDGEDPLHEAIGAALEGQG
ncbi:hypothetical protein PanWU01x14_201600 [Parasponia andersonii]|uniref:Transmembrane protein n=1 Tax=Parasponia andersonii TaxID=3476 RepID=A0A2P5BXD0_PARAD|nr:hypothetical protein PanWU01x14_201600 [Parasponia andersonii]